MLHDLFFTQSALSLDLTQVWDLVSGWDFLMLWLKSGLCLPDLEFGVFTIYIRPNWLSEYLILVDLYCYVTILENSECQIIPWDTTSFLSSPFATM